MTEKQFIFREFEISPTNDFINNLKLYEIDNDNASSFDYSNYFVVYCDSEENVKSIINKLNELTHENNQLKREKKRYKQLSEIRAENVNNRILTIKEFINNCEDEKVKDTLEDLFYSEVKEYDLAKENRELKKEVERLTCINKQLEERLDKDIALNMDCGDIDD